MRMSLPSSQHLAAADRDGARVDGREAPARVARVLDRERMRLAEGGAEEPPRLLLVARRGHDEVGQLAQRGEREDALVAGAVLADEAGTVDADDDRRVVLADVVDDLVEGALQERRVQRDEGALAREREARRQRHRVLLGDADVVEAPGEGLAEARRARCRSACRR